MHISSLTCEYRENPIGIDAHRPRLSWRVESSTRGASQSAYQILAASSAQDLARDHANLWDSGKVKSDGTIHISYGGKPLASGERVWWKVRAWDESGRPTEASSPAHFEMGLLKKTDWVGEWIGGNVDGGKRSMPPVPFLRREFTLSKPVASARLYATALGLYECYLNGKRVGDDVFTPGWTDYRKRVQYQAYDVTTLLHEGVNAVGAILGDGWYCGHMEANGRQTYGDRSKFLAQINVVFADGSSTVIASDGDWTSAYGPILESDIFMGEAYDARLDLGAWSEPGAQDSKWGPVRTYPGTIANLVATPGPTVRRQEELRPIAPPAIKQDWNRSRQVFDLGQNMVGWIRLKVSGPAGTTLTIRYSEILQPNGEPYYTNLRSARATDYFTLSGNGIDTFEPRFTFHGFRYVEITGLSDQVTIVDGGLIGVVIHSEMPATGDFKCSDPLINQLQSNIKWGQKGNFVDVPTDCPQRDERQGWTGDAQVFIRTAAFNRQVGGFFTKWLRDLDDSQDKAGHFPMVAPLSWIPYGDRDEHGKIDAGRHGSDGGPAWADAGIICPWTIYQCYADRQSISEHYESMVLFINSLTETAKDYIRCYPGSGQHCFGDWLALDGSGKTEGGTRYDLIGTAFFAHSTKLLAKMASALGKKADSAKYDALAERVRQAFNKQFVTAEGLVVGSTQTAYVLALHFDLLPEKLRANAALELVRDIRSRGTHLSTGFVGAAYLPDVLTATGHIDVAYELLFQKSWPSYLYPVTQGATTIWERWDGWTADKGFQDYNMNSFNHYAYGAVGDWLYRTVAGIDLGSPGYKTITLRPRPGGGLTNAGATLDSVHGEIASEWRIDDESLYWKVRIPANTTAIAYIPAKSAGSVTESGSPLGHAGHVAIKRESVDGVEVSLGSGEYLFVVSDPILV